MNQARGSMIVRVTGLAAALALAVGGCGGSGDSSSSTTATSASATSSGAPSSSDTVTSSASMSAATPDYALLLAKPTDFPANDAGPWTVTPPRAIPPDPPGVSQTYTSGPDQIGGPNQIDCSIVVTDDATGAEVFLQGSAEGVPSQVIGGKNVSLPAVSPDAMFTSGKSRNGRAEEAALLFTVQNTAVIMIFGGPLGHPVPQGFAEAVAKAQTAAIEAALPRLR